MGGDTELLDPLGRQIHAGDLVAFGVRSGNTGETRVARVVSIDWEGARTDYRGRLVPKVGVRSFAATGYGNPSGKRTAYPDPFKLVRLEPLD